MHVPQADKTKTRTDNAYEDLQKTTTDQIPYTHPLDLNGEKNLDTKVLAVLHELAVENDLISANTVALGVGRVCCLADLDLSPLTIGRDLKRQYDTLPMGNPNHSLAHQGPLLA